VLKPYRVKIQKVVWVKHLCQIKKFILFSNFT
jgi:hypothetical protein